MLSGTIKSASADGFVLSYKKLGSVRVTANATTTIIKGARVISLNELSAGDKVSVVGSIRPTNLLEIDATSLRNLSF